MMYFGDYLILFFDIVAVIEPRGLLCSHYIFIKKYFSIKLVIFVFLRMIYLFAECDMLFNNAYNFEDK